MSDRQQALKVLGLADGANDEEVRLAYKKLSMKWHPDKNQGSSEATHMMQQLNAAKDRLGQEGEYSDEDEYESDGYYDSDEYEGEDYDDDPFGGPTMNFAAFLRMYARMREAGQIDDYGDYVPASSDKARGTRGGEFCYCPECMRLRRASKEEERQAKREQARQRRMEQEVEAAEARALEEADRRLQQTDPKASVAWKRGGEHRERVIREHFLRQTPRLLLHAATDSSLTLVLDAPDLSLLHGKLPPKGVEWEVSYSCAADKKWTNLLATREYDNILLTKLRPGTEYAAKVRTGLAGSHTWSGTPDWGGWGAAHKFKTSGEARNGAGSAAPAAPRPARPARRRRTGTPALRRCSPSGAMRGRSKTAKRGKSRMNSMMSSSKTSRQSSKHQKTQLVMMQQQQTKVLMALRQQQPRAAAPLQLQNQQHMKHMKQKTLLKEMSSCRNRHRSRLQPQHRKVLGYHPCVCTGARANAGMVPPASSATCRCRAWMTRQQGRPLPRQQQQQTASPWTGRRRRRRRQQRRERAGTWTRWIGSWRSAAAT
ncbi:hypothetical protein COO60DRAFT_486587 [Scenedesmus sp. NREL 46B-D3]|nr:hypothetical protein COO60DRAFT_486587 [Scenedesmus sp. NREL 46B-D3]